MVSIVVDPALVMLPPDDASREDVEAWFERLEIWLNEALTAPFMWLHYVQATDLLEANGHFPAFPQLKRLKEAYSLNVNIIQLARRINEFFRDETLDLKGHLEQLDFIIEAQDGSIIVKPEQFITRLPVYIHEDFYPMLADCCVCKHMDYAFGQGLYIATLAIDGNTKEIVISVVVVEAEPNFVRPLDNRIEQRFPLLITPDDLQPLINVIEMWAKGEQGIMYAISQQYTKDWSGVVATPLTFRLGSRFMASVNSRGLDNSEIVLSNIVRAAASVIAGTAKDVPRYKLHHLRRNETADSPQRTRESDNAKAWRLMVQQQGAGWRLHYWQIPTPDGSIIEFANVCKESESEIF